MNTTSAWLFCAILYVLPPSACAWDVEPEELLASLNRSETRQALGVRDVRRPDGVANRLDVIFEDGVSPDARSRVLQQIGRDFLLALFQWQGIPTVTVVERNAAGTIVDRVVVNLVGASPGAPGPVSQTRDPC